MPHRVEGVRVISSLLSFTGKVNKFQPAMKGNTYMFTESLVEMFEVDTNQMGLIDEVRFGGVGSGTALGDLVEVLKATRGNGLLLVIWDDGSSADVVAVADGDVRAYDLIDTLEYLEGDVVSVVASHGVAL